MPYSDFIDPTTPPDDEETSSGDDRIRELKRAIMERFATVFSNWPDGEPLHIASAALVDSIIVESMLNANSVSTGKVQDLSITTQKLADKAVTGGKVADHTLATLNYGAGSVDTAAIADLAVTSPKIANVSVLTQHLQDLGVTSPKIADDAVIEQKLGDEAVSTRALANGSVTLPKMAASNDLLRYVTHVDFHGSSTASDITMIEIDMGTPVLEGDLFSIGKAPGSPASPYRDCMLVFQRVGDISANHARFVYWAPNDTVYARVYLYRRLGGAVT